ncbi:MAG: hypothetical protein ACOVRN_00625, partial [Flavobacterium sp.]
MGNAIERKTEQMGNDIWNKTNQLGSQIEQETKQMGNEIERKTEKMGNDIWNRTNQLGSQIEQGAKQMGNEIERKTEQMGNEIVKKTEEMGKEIEKKTVTFVTEKLKSVFIQLGDIFNKGLVMPILAVFTGIGDIFIQVFNIIKEIGNKIVSLPSCIFVYGIKESIDTYFFLYDKLLPRFIRDIFGFFYRYVFRFIFDFIAYITGYDTSVRKCYGFNVSSEVDGINGSLNNIQSTFKKDFGRMDFSKINI